MKSWLFIIGMIFSSYVSWTEVCQVKEQGTDYIILEFNLKNDGILSVGKYSKTNKNMLQFIENNIDIPKNFTKSDNLILGKIKKGKSVLKVNKLNLSSDYNFNIVYQDKEIEKLTTIKTNTLAFQPYKPSRGIRIKDTEPGCIEFIWNEGKGINRKIIVSNNKYIKIKDGNDYKSGNQKYGVEESKVSDGTYVVFDSKSNKDVKGVKLVDLEYKQYYISVIEYNGEGKYVNYNIDSSLNNPKSVYPKLFPPKALPVNNFEENIFSAKWEKVQGSVFYEIQVAKDKNFNEILEEYNNADVSNSSEFDIWVDDMTIEYYFRVRAISNNDKSDYSNVINVNFGQK